MPAAPIDLLARFVATVRLGRTVELIDETPGQRITRSVTRFRIGPSRVDKQLEFQIETETTCRGQSAVCPFSYCDWTAQGIMETLVEYEGAPGMSLVALLPDDDLVAIGIARMGSQPFQSPPFTYSLIDGAIRVRDYKREWSELSSIHHPLDEMVTVDLSAEALRAISA